MTKVLHLVLEVLCISGHIDNANNVNLGAQQPLIADCLKDFAANAAKTIDAKVGRHAQQLGAEPQLRARTSTFIQIHVGKLLRGKPHLELITPY